jgi:chromosome partitioning protein
MSLILSVVNQKGGCGKTTTSVHLACALATLDRRVLLIDLDPQGHATMGLGLHAGDHAPPLSEVLAHSPLSGLGRGLHETIVAARPGIDCVPSNLGLAALEAKLSSVPGREDRLAEHLSEIGRGWELILIDAPPNLGLLTINALVASHESLIPIEPSPFSLQGAERVIDTIDLVREMTGHRLEHRLLPTMIGPRDRHAATVVEQARQRWGGRVMQHAVRRSVLFARSAARGRGVGELAPRAPAWQDYVRVAHELLETWQAEGRVEARRFRGLRVIPDGVAFDHPTLPPSQVRLAGDFNHWEPDRNVRLLQFVDGWEKRLEVPPGRYEYKFLLEGVWTPDPWNPRHVYNPHGTENSVIEVPPPVPRGSIFRERRGEAS